MNEILVIMMLVGDIPVNLSHEYTYERHGALARQTCLNHRVILTRRYEKNPDIEIIYLDCPNHWSET